MIAIRRLDPRVATAGQLRPGDMRAVADMGFRAVINNRPDGEAWFGQPAAQALHDAAAAAGLRIHYLPIVTASLGLDDVRRFREAVETCGGPVLAFCASGFRCALVWALAEATFGGAALDDAIGRAAAAGHDLSRSRELIVRIARQG